MGSNEDSLNRIVFFGHLWEFFEFFKSAVGFESLSMPQLNGLRSLATHQTMRPETLARYKVNKEEPPSEANIQPPQPSVISLQSFFISISHLQSNASKRIEKDPTRTKLRSARPLLPPKNCRFFHHGAHGARGHGTDGPGAPAADAAAAQAFGAAERERLTASKDAKVPGMSI